MRIAKPFIVSAFFLAGCVDFHRAVPSSPASASPGIKYQVIQKADVNGVSTWAVLPPLYSGQKENPWIIYNHGFGQTIQSILANNPQSAFVNALVSAGFVVIASQYRDLACWGNQGCVEDIANLQILWQSQLSLAPKPFVIGESMGGIVTWNSISRGTLTPAAVVGIYPVCNLAAMYKNSVFAPTIQSAFGFTSALGYAPATGGYDPMLTAASQFDSFPIAIWASYADRVVTRSLNEDPFARSIREAGGTVTVYSSFGDHGDASNFDSQRVIAFFESTMQTTAAGTKLDGAYSLHFRQK